MTALTTPSDRELLELAAKAAGLDEVMCPDGWTDEGPWRWNEELKWNPIMDDGDALRLDLLQSSRFTHERDVLMFTKGTPRLEATRRAIVRAASEIGKGTP